MLVRAVKAAKPMSVLPKTPSAALHESAKVVLVDRALYPVDQYPVGRWDYWPFYREHLSRAAQGFGADVQATLSLLYRTASAEAAGKLARSASTVHSRLADPIWKDCSNLTEATITGGHELSLDARMTSM